MILLHNALLSGKMRARASSFSDEATCYAIYLQNWSFLILTSKSFFLFNSYIAIEAETATFRLPTEPNCGIVTMCLQFDTNSLGKPLASLPKTIAQFSGNLKLFKSSESSLISIAMTSYFFL